MGALTLRAGKAIVRCFEAEGQPAEVRAKVAERAHREYVVLVRAGLGRPGQGPDPQDLLLRRTQICVAVRGRAVLAALGLSRFVMRPREFEPAQTAPSQSGIGWLRGRCQTVMLMGVGWGDGAHLLYEYGIDCSV